MIVSDHRTVQQYIISAVGECGLSKWLLFNSCFFLFFCVVLTLLHGWVTGKWKAIPPVKSPAPTITKSLPLEDPVQPGVIHI